MLITIEWPLSYYYDHYMNHRFISVVIRVCFQLGQYIFVWHEYHWNTATIAIIKIRLIIPQHNKNAPGFNQFDSVFYGQCQHMVNCCIAKIGLRHYINNAFNAAMEYMIM